MPYWIKPLIAGGRWDDGQVRPLPASPDVISYMCQAIHPGTYVPGQPLNVSVDVLNSGGGNTTAIVLVTVYWADPTVGFAKPKFLAATTVLAQPSPTAPAFSTTAIMTGIIPANAPAHVCLVVSVSHPQDKAGNVCDPVGDRHWAQRNLMAAVAAEAAMISFAVGNPFNRDKKFDLLVQPVGARRAAPLTSQFGAIPVQIEASLRLLNEQGRPLSDKGPQARAAIRLGPSEEQRIKLEVELNGRLSARQAIAVEALLLDASQDGRLVGSLGAVILNH